MAYRSLQVGLICLCCVMMYLSVCFVSEYKLTCGPGSVVGIAIGYGLDGLVIESQWGARFSAPIQTGPGTHPASCTMPIGPFPGVNSGRA